MEEEEIVIKPIRIYGDPVLEQVCMDVTDFNSSETKGIIKDLLDTCQATSNSAGLAAPQIGILKRVAVVRTEFDQDDMDTFVVLINPRITSSGGQSEEKEGCLSIPGHYDKMVRPKIVTVDYQDELGVIKSIRGTGTVARVLVHEIDHLDGRLFIHHFGNAYCAAVKEWLGRQSKEGSVEEPNDLPVIPVAEAPNAAPESSSEAYQPFEASFVQAEESESDIRSKRERRRDRRETEDQQP